MPTWLVWLNIVTIVTIVVWALYRYGPGQALWAVAVTYAAAIWDLIKLLPEFVIERIEKAAHEFEDRQPRKPK